MTLRGACFCPRLYFLKRSVIGLGLPRFRSPRRSFSEGGSYRQISWFLSGGEELALTSEDPPLPSIDVVVLILFIILAFCVCLLCYQHRE
jgi:hypothetical protein